MLIEDAVVLDRALEGLHLAEMDPDALVAGMAAIAATAQLGREPRRIRIAEILFNNRERLGWAHHHQSWTLDEWADKARHRRAEECPALTRELCSQYLALKALKLMYSEQLDDVLEERLTLIEKAVMDNKERLAAFAHSY